MRFFALLLLFVAGCAGAGHMTASVNFEERDYHNPPVIVGRVEWRN